MSSNRLQEMREKSRKRKELLKHSLGRHYSIGRLIFIKFFSIFMLVEVLNGVYETLGIF